MQKAEEVLVELIKNYLLYGDPLPSTILHFYPELKGHKGDVEVIRPARPGVELNLFNEPYLGAHQTSARDLVKWKDRHGWTWSPEEEKFLAKLQQDQRKMIEYILNLEDAPRVRQYPIGSYGIDVTGNLMQLRLYHIDGNQITFPEGRPGSRQRQP